MDPVFLTITSILTIVAAGAGAYIGSWFRKSGEIDAVNSKLDDVVKQTAALTQITATINTQISRGDWGEREVVTLRRTKLEELLLALYEADDYVGSRLQLALEGKAPGHRDKSLHKIQVITALYFNELATDVAKFVSVYLAATRAGIELRSAAFARDQAFENSKIKG